MEFYQLYQFSFLFFFFSLLFFSILLRPDDELMNLLRVCTLKQDYRDLLVESMKDAFPDLKDYLENQQLPEQRASSSSTATSRSLPATTPTTVLINGGNDPSSSSMNGRSQLPPQGPPHGGIQNGMATTVENGRGEEDVKMEQDFR